MVRMASGVWPAWLVACHGESPAKTETALSPADIPRSTWSGSQGLSSSASAMHQLYFPACPNVALSSSPGIAPITLIAMSRIARPIVALARRPGPKMLTPEFRPICRPMGPLTTIRIAAPMVLAVIACRLNWSSQIASAAARTTGKYSGLHPAITALIAAFSAVITLPLTGSVPSTSDASLPPASRNVSTKSSVGGMIGNPSLQPRSWYSSFASRKSFTS